MTWDSLYYYERYFDNIFLDFIQYFAIFLVLATTIISTIFYYLNQNIQLKLIKLFHVIDELLILHQIDTSKLIFRTDLKYFAVFVSIVYITILFVFFYLHFIPGREKHITVHFVSLLQGAYRGHLWVSQLFFIRRRHILLNNLLTKLFKESNKLPNVICARCNLIKVKHFKLEELCVLHKLK